jgi:hypothetical protein
MDARLGLSADADLSFYSIAGEQVARAYTEEDFLRCPDTRATLECEWEDRVATTLRLRAEALAEELVREEQGRESSVLGRTTPGAFAGELAAVLEAHLRVEYRFAIFAESPELADPLASFLQTVRR